MTAPISYMVPDSPAALRRLSQLLKEERLRLIEQLCAAPNWEDFKEQVGRIRGIDLALRVAAEIEKEMRN